MDKLTKRGTNPLPNNDETKPAIKQDEDDGKSFMFYIKRIAQAVYKEFINTPPSYRNFYVVISIVVLVIGSRIVVEMINFLQADMNLIYLILAILSSYIVIKDGMLNRKGKK